MESIENIKSTYRHIADEAQQQLNKVQRQIYRIGTLRLLLFIAGVAGLIWFPGGKLGGTGRDCACHPSAFYPADKIP